MPDSNQPLKIAYRPVSELIPYARNSRTHNDAQVAQIAASIREFGFTNPILIDEAGGIIAGHGRCLAARKLGMADVPTITLVGLSDTQKRAYVIADNKLALNAGWDEESLMTELHALAEANFDLGLTGFDADELLKLLPDTSPGLTDEDAVPEVPAQPVTVLGDIWLLGSHRLMCGDSIKIDEVEKLMAGQKADMVFTSPPYNANTSFGTLHKNNMGKLYEDGYSDNLDSNDYIKMCSSILGICFNFVEGFIFWNVNYNAHSRSEYLQQITNYLPNLIEQICWKKNSVIPYKGGLRRIWEPIFVFKSGKEKTKFGNDKVEDNFWEISNTGSQIETHRGCFPLELPEKGISLVKSETGIVFDPFGGSGTTMIACEKTGRHARLMELDPKYCDVIIKRWQEFVGKQATLESNGKTFEEVSCERTAA